MHLCVRWAGYTSISRDVHIVYNVPNDITLKENTRREKTLGSTDDDEWYDDERRSG